MWQFLHLKSNYFDYFLARPRGVRVDLTLVFSRVVEFQMSSYRILEGSGSTLFNVFEVRGIPDAPLSHIKGVGVNFT